MTFPKVKGNLQTKKNIYRSAPRKAKQDRSLLVQDVCFLTKVGYRTTLPLQRDVCLGCAEMGLREHGVENLFGKYSNTSLLKGVFLHHFQKQRKRKKIYSFQVGSVL